MEEPVIDPTDAPPGYIAEPITNNCNGCAFLGVGNSCPITPAGYTHCFAGSRKDSTSVIFKKKEVQTCDPTEAPPGYVAEVSRNGCVGCAMYANSMCSMGAGYSSTGKCVPVHRKDRAWVIFKKAETDKQETPKPLDLSSFDDATLQRTIALLLQEVTRRRIATSDEPPF
jgi:hypothetical protein